MLILTNFSAPNVGLLIAGVVSTTIQLIHRNWGPCWKKKQSWSPWWTPALPSSSNRSMFSLRLGRLCYGVLSTLNCLSLLPKISVKQHLHFTKAFFGLKVLLKYLDPYPDLYYLQELDTDPGLVNTDPNHAGLGICSFQKNVPFFPFNVLFKRMFRSFCSFRSFAFFSKERPVLLRSFQKNVPFFPFFYVLFKRSFRSFRSFPFF